MNILGNLESVFTGGYFHYENLPEPESEESIAERTKLRLQRLKRSLALNCLKDTLSIRVQKISTRLWMIQKALKKIRPK